MKERKRPVRVEFFGGEVNAPMAYGSVFAVLDDIKGKKIPLRAVEVGGYPYELRELAPIGDAYQGVIGKFRQDNLPRIGRIDASLDTSEEHDIPMQDDEGLIEKTHFVYYKRPPLLLMQLNREGPRVNHLSRYLSELSGERVDFPVVLRRDAYERMLSDDMQARSISLRIARPHGVDVLRKAVENAKGGEFLKEILHLMDSNRAATIVLTLQGSLGKKSASRTLNGSIKNRMAAVFNNFAGTDMLETAKLQMENDDGEVGLVDLITDTLFTKISVEMEGRYPNKTAMFREMMRSRDTVLEDLSAFFKLTN